MENRDICVTEEDIANGVPLDGNSCPIALALQREFPDFDVSVGKDWLLIEKPGAFMRVYTSAKQYRFVRRFDKEKSVKPFCFSFPEPFTSLNLISDFTEQLSVAREKASKR